MQSTSFREQVYELAKKIPVGKVATYGQLARLSGRPKASRAIGLFMRTNPNAPVTPCHRVVSSSGALTGYSAEGGVVKKRDMLEKEGVVFVGDKVNLEVSLWNGK
ncbi:MGMT family protein [Candidatus Woesebacteria bacterium]|jgi:O-6-methylguanine DNA methyltransferase|nr:MGMT family protein [Candidatus Woesebacteria bacterium]